MRHVTQLDYSNPVNVIVPPRGSAVRKFVVFHKPPRTVVFPFKLPNISKVGAKRFTPTSPSFVGRATNTTSIQSWSRLTSELPWGSSSRLMSKMLSPGVRLVNSRLHRSAPVEALDTFTCPLTWVPVMMPGSPVGLLRELVDASAAS